MRMGRGLPEGLIEAWSNLYREVAIAVAARRDSIDLLADCLGFPLIQEGVDGVKFINACVSSNNNKNWIQFYNSQLDVNQVIE